MKQRVEVKDKWFLQQGRTNSADGKSAGGLVHLVHVKQYLRTLHAEGRSHGQLSKRRVDPGLLLLLLVEHPLVCLQASPIQPRGWKRLSQAVWVTYVCKRALLDNQRGAVVKQLLLQRGRSKLCTPACVHLEIRICPLFTW